MIELLPDMPKGVTGVRVSGRLGGDELRELKPSIEDMKLAFGTVWPHHSAFKRIAVVSDKEWVALTLHAVAWLIPGELAVFKLDELERAKEWAAG
jgi:hypothetical protein